MTREPRRDGLPTPDQLAPTADLDQLREHLRRRVPLDPGGRPAARQVASDPTGSVTVTVDARGRVVDVAISGAWRDRLDGSQFAEAVFGAYTAAVQQAVEAEAAAIATRGDEEVPDLRSAATDRSTPVLRDSPDDTAEWLGWIREQFSRIRTEVEQASGRAGAGTEPRLHTGPHGYLTATLQGQTVVGVAGDPHQIWYAEGARLRDDALAILTPRTGVAGDTPQSRAAGDTPRTRAAGDTPQSGAAGDQDRTPTQGAHPWLFP